MRFFNNFNLLFLAANKQDLHDQEKVLIFHLLKTLFVIVIVAFQNHFKIEIQFHTSSHFLLFLKKNFNHAYLPSQMSKKDNYDMLQYAKLYCLCRDVEYGFMLQCSDCHEWFHGKCVNVTPEQGKLMDDYICPNCQLCNDSEIKQIDNNVSTGGYHIKKLGLFCKKLFFSLPLYLNNHRFT